MVHFHNAVSSHRGFFVGAVYFRRDGHFITLTSSGGDIGQHYSTSSGCDVCLNIFQLVFAPLSKSVL